MQSGLSIPSFNAKGEPPTRYEKEVEIWYHITTLGASKRGRALVLQMAARAQEIGVAINKTEVISADGVKKILKEI